MLTIEERLNKLEEAVFGRESEQSEWSGNVATKELDCGLTIAMEDYYEIDGDGNKKTEFTYDEAMEIEKKTGGKWRLPTMAEWAQICDELGVKDHILDRDKVVKTLNLTEDSDGFGYYWSSTLQSGSNAYYLCFNSSDLSPAYRNSRGNGFSVRCVLAK